MALSHQSVGSRVAAAAWWAQGSKAHGPILTWEELLRERTRHHHISMIAAEPYEECERPWAPSTQFSYWPWSLVQVWVTGKSVPVSTDACSSGMVCPGGLLVQWRTFPPNPQGTVSHGLSVPVLDSTLEGHILDWAKEADL